MRLLSPRVLAITLLLVAGTSGCTYESGAGPRAGRDAAAARVVDDSEPSGPLAFTVDGLASSQWRVHDTDVGLNLRVRPGTANRSLGRLTPGTIVTATGDVMTIDDATWFHVDTGDRAGWVHADFLLPVDPAVPEPAGPVTVEPRWPAGTLVAVASEPDADLREGPAGPVVAQLDVGTELVTTGAAAEAWTEVRSSNLRGWVATDSLAAVELDEVASPFAMGTPVSPAVGLDGTSLHAVPEGEVLGGVPATETATATGRARDGWTEVTHRGVTGWARTLELTEAPPSTPVPDTARVAGEGGIVTVHFGPSGLEDIIATLDDGAAVTPTGITTAAGWTEIQLDDARTGWVPTVFLVTETS